MPRKLILVGPLPTATQVAGQSIGFALLVDGLRARGIEPAVVDIAGAETGRGGGWSGRRVFEYVGILARYLLTVIGRPGTIYITVARSPHGFLRDLVMVFLGSIFRHRFIGHVKGGDYGVFYDNAGPRLRFLIRWTLRRFDTMLVLGEGLREMFDFLPEFAPRIEVVANGLPFAADTPGTGKTLPDSQTLPGSQALPAGKSADANEPIRILFLSNLIESKGYFELLEATRLLVRERGHKIEVRFCGAFQANRADDVRVADPEQARRLFDAFVAEHDLAGSVRYVGVVGGQEKIAELNGAHFFVLPTRYICEGQPISIIEALAYGCVVVSTDFRAIPEVVEHNKSGLLIGTGEIDGLGVALDELIKDPDRYARLSAAAVARFQEHFTREAHLDRLLPHLLRE